MVKGKNRGIAPFFYFKYVLNRGKNGLKIQKKGIYILRNIQDKAIKGERK